MKKLLFSFIIVGILFTAITSCNNERKERIRNHESDSVDVVEPIYMYGIPIDSFNVVQGQIKRNQSLSDILPEYGIGYATIDIIGRKWDTVFDVRKIRTGNSWTVFCNPDTSCRAAYFIYERTPVEFVVFDFTDSVRVYLNEKPIVPRMKHSSGIIESSLWNAIAAQDLNRMLALELENIYAWSVDFFGLQKGDSFTVLYDEEYVDSISVGIGRIHAACFKHYDSLYYAFPYIQDSVISFFDMEGNSLRKAFLKAPLKFSRISSKFSNSRFHPVLKIRRPHHGVDYAAPVGTPVMAIGDGKVIKAGWSGGAGRLVKIKHNSVYQTAYMHLSKFGKGIQEGKFVKQGDIIGYVGNSGLSTGPHLDFRFYKNGQPVDPLKVEAPPVDPIRKEELEGFHLVRDSLLKLLNSEFAVVDSLMQ